MQPHAPLPAFQPFALVFVNREHEPPAGRKKRVGLPKRRILLANMHKRQRGKDHVKCFLERLRKEISLGQLHVRKRRQILPRAGNRLSRKINPNKRPAARRDLSRQPTRAHTNLKRALRAVQRKPLHENRPVPLFHIRAQRLRIVYGIVSLRHQRVIMRRNRNRFHHLIHPSFKTIIAYWKDICKDWKHI